MNTVLRANKLTVNKLRIAIFLDHDVMIRHFLHSEVFNKLFDMHDVDVVMPPKGYKRTTLDPSAYLAGANLIHLPIHEKSRSIWGRMMQVKVMRPRLDRFSMDLRRTWRLVLPWRVELLHTILGAPGIFRIYKQWASWQAHKFPNLKLRELLSKKAYDLVLNPGLPDGHYLDDLIIETRRFKIPLIYIMNSWDNPSTGPFAAGKPDYFLAWGKQTERHAHIYQGMDPRRTFGFGAAQFEIYKKPPRITRADFCVRHNIDPSKRIILYAGGSLGTNEFEHLQLLEEAISAGRYGDAVIVYRPHPWGGGGNAGEQIIDHAWIHVRIESTMRAYLESLKSHGYHMTFPDCADTHDVLSAVDCVISPLSTILIEAAMHGKPIMCFLPLEDVSARHFQTVHCLPHFRELQENPEVVLAAGREEMLAKLPRLFAMETEPNFVKKQEKMCNYFVAIHDRPYSERLCTLVEDIVSKHKVDAEQYDC